MHALQVPHSSRRKMIGAQDLKAFTEYYASASTEWTPLQFKKSKQMRKKYS